MNFSNMNVIIKVKYNNYFKTPLPNDTYDHMYSILEYIHPVQGQIIKTRTVISLT